MKKTVMVVLALVLVIAMSVAGTMAYLTSTDSVTNTFTVGNVKITLDEADVDNSTPDKDRDQANSYKLIPGTTYVKDPIVHVDADSEDCYLFVKVVNGISKIEGGTTIAAQMTAKGWKAVAEVENVYVYALGEANKTPVTAGTDVPVFEEFTVAGTADMSKVDPDNDKIVVTAYAVQAEGFAEKNPAEIWTAAGFTA